VSAPRSGCTSGDGPRGLRRVSLRVHSGELEPIESPQPDTLELSTSSAFPLWGHAFVKQPCSVRDQVQPAGAVMLTSGALAKTRPVAKTSCQLINSYSKVRADVLEESL